MSANPIVFIRRTVEYAEALPAWCAHSPRVDYVFVDDDAALAAAIETHGIDVIPCALLPDDGIVTDVAALDAWIAAHPPDENETTR